METIGTGHNKKANVTITYKFDVSISAAEKRMAVLSQNSVHPHYYSPFKRED